MHSLRRALTAVWAGAALGLAAALLLLVPQGALIGTGGEASCGAAERAENRLDFMVLDSRSSQKWAWDTGRCNRPSVRVVLGYPPRVFTVALDHTTAVGNRSDTDLTMWASAALLSTTFRPLDDRDAGAAPSGRLRGLDYLHAGSVHSHRAGAGAENYAKGLLVRVTYAEHLATFGCDGMLHVEPDFVGDKPFLARFNHLVLTEEFLTLLSADADAPMRALPAAVGSKPLELRAAPDATALGLANVTFGLDGALDDALDHFPHCRDLQQKANAGEVAGTVTLWPDTDALGRSAVFATGTVHELLACACAQSATSSVTVLVAGVRLNTKQACTLDWSGNAQARTAATLADTQLHLPWTLLGPRLAYGTLAATAAAGAGPGPPPAAATAVIFAAADESVQYSARLMAMFLLAGAGTWALRDHMSAAAAAEFGAVRHYYAVQHGLLELKLLLTCAAFFAVERTLLADQLAPTVVDVHDTCSYAWRFASSLATATLCAAASWATAAGAARASTEQTLCVSHARTYALSTLLSLSLWRLLSTCVVGLPLHIVSACVALLDTYVSASALFALYTVAPYATLVRAYASLSHRAPPAAARARGLHPAALLLCALVGADMGVTNCCDFFDITLALTSTVLPAYGLPVVWVVVFVLVFEIAGSTRGHALLTRRILLLATRKRRAAAAAAAAAADAAQ
jgi:hypothetical protein